MLLNRVTEKEPSCNPTEHDNQTNNQKRALTHDARCRLTSQAQRPGPRGRWIATRTRWPGSLQRMVRHRLQSIMLHSKYGLEILLTVSVGLSSFCFGSERLKSTSTLM